jgi:hypothetical protein
MKRLIKNSFPELRYHIIMLRFIKTKHFFMATSGFLFIHIIFIDKRLKKCTDDVVTGIMAHELVHISQDSFWKDLLYRKSITDMERATDMQVIKRGYGKQLLAFIQYHNKIYKKYKKADGLTEKEIIKILKK